MARTSLISWTPTFCSNWINWRKRRNCYSIFIDYRQERGDMEEEEEGPLDDEMMEAYAEVRNKQALKKIEHNMKKRQRAHGKNRDLDEATEKMEGLGIDTEKFRERIRAQKKQEKLSTLVKRKRNGFKADAALESDEDAMLDEAEENQ